MRFLKFANGDEMPALGLGTWKSDKGEVYKALRTAIEIGYRHIDCALLYGNEPEIGEAFTDSIKAGDVNREDLFITSKLWNNAHYPEAVLPNIQTSLKNLQLDYLDLYLIHWPVALKPHIIFPEKGEDMLSINEIPLETTWAAMVPLKEIGLAKHIGVSNFSISKLEKISASAGVKPEVNQVESHLYLQQNELLNYCKTKGILFTAYCPLGSADRPANRIIDGEPKLFQDQVIKSISEKMGISQAQVMLAWAVQRGTAAIPKSVNAQRLMENLEAADITIEDEDMAKLKALNNDFRYIQGQFWCIPGSDYTFEGLWG